MKIVVNCSTGGFSVSHNLDDLGPVPLTLLHDALRSAEWMVKEALRGNRQPRKAQRVLYKIVATGELYTSKVKAGRALKPGVNWPHRACDHAIRAGLVEIVQ